MRQLSTRISNISFFVFVYTLTLVSNSLIAQPSGGPYGPIQVKYQIPSNVKTVCYVSPNGSASKSGESLDSPTTIEAAFDKIKSGDVIILRGGTYRTGNLVFNQSITLQPYEDELPIVKGTKVAENWENLGNGLWTTHWEDLFPAKPQNWWRRHREGKKTPLHRFNNDMLFIDGKFLQSAGWEGEVDENRFYIDYETSTVYIGTDPSDKLVEITSHDAALIRTTKSINGNISDGKGPIIKGIKFTQYAYRAIEIEGKDPDKLSAEENHGKDVVGTTIENCSITYCSRVAAYLRGDHLTIRNCLISDTSTEGLFILSSSDVLLEKNILRRNNIENITGYYPAAVKIFNQSYRVTCNDNLVIEHPNSNGIWYDVGNVDGVFTNNWIEGVGFNDSEVREDQIWPSRNGFFFEISKGAVCFGNVFINCDHGLMILNSSDVSIYNNTFINSMAVIGRNERSAQGDHFGWHPSTGPDVDERINHKFVNNLISADGNFNRPLLYVWQSKKICKEITSQQFEELNNNIYIRKHTKDQNPILFWGPANNEECRTTYYTLEKFKNLLPEFSSSSVYFNNYDGPLFKGVELNNYQTLNSFEYSEKGIPLPNNIKDVYNQEVDFVGAYSPIK